MNFKSRLKKIEKLINKPLKEGANGNIDQLSRILCGNDEVFTELKKKHKHLNLLVEVIKYCSYRKDID